MCGRYIPSEARIGIFYGIRKFVIIEVVLSGFENSITIVSRSSPVGQKPNAIRSLPPQVRIQMLSFVRNNNREKIYTGIRPSY